MSVEFWKTVFDWTSVVLVGFTFVAGAGALITGRILNDRQSFQLQQMNEDLTKAKTDLETQRGLTAKAQREASEAALALAKFKAPRAIPPERQEAFIASLKPFAGQDFAWAVFPDPESIALSRILVDLLKEAGWRRVSPQIQREGGVLMDVSGEAAATVFDSGVDAYIAPDDMESVGAQHALCSSLVSVGIPCENHRTPQLAGKTPRAITVSVGKKQ